MKLQVFTEWASFRRVVVVFLFFLFFSLVVSLTSDLPHGSESAGVVGFAGKALCTRVDETEQKPRSGAG